MMMSAVLTTRVCSMNTSGATWDNHAPGHLHD